MGRRHYTAEQIIGMLREAEVLQSQGMTIGEVSRQLGISEQTYYRWRKEYGGMRVDQAKLSRAIRHVCERLKVSQRRACKVLGQPRSTRRSSSSGIFRICRWVERTISLASQFGRYGYRRITAMLRREGWERQQKRISMLRERNSCRTETD
jgi:putative transposase